LSQNMFSIFLHSKTCLIQIFKFLQLMFANLEDGFNFSSIFDSVYECWWQI
jgi:hypothetical protein